MNRRSHRIATALLALTLIITTLPARALPPGVAALGAGVAYAAMSGSDLQQGILPLDRNPTQAMAMGDVDNDGDLDLVVGNNGQTNKLYLNNGTRTPFSDLSTGTLIGSSSDATYALALGDVNNDSYLDLIVGNYGQNKLYLNNRTATPFNQYSVSSFISADPDQTRSVALGDVNNDGYLDIVTGNADYNKLYINNKTELPFNEEGTGVRIGSYSTSTFSVALGDLNNDGYLDIVAGNSGNNYLYLNNKADSAFNPDTVGVSITADNDYTHAVALGDVDNDGNLDLIAGNVMQYMASPGYNKVYLNEGPTTLFSNLPTGKVINQESNLALSIALGDMDNDGDLDLITGTSPWCRSSCYWGLNKLYLNNGTADPFTTSEGMSIGDYTQVTYSVAVGDIDNDRDLDVVFGNSTELSDNGENRLYLNNAELTAPSSYFLTGTTIGDSNRYNSIIEMGDMNGDGALDIITNEDSVSPELMSVKKLYINNKTANPFVNVSGITISNDNDATFALAVGDVNGDGHLDLIASNRDSCKYTANMQVCSNGGNKLYINNGDTYPFADITQGTMIGIDINGINDIALGDVDGDGDLDLVNGNEPICENINGTKVCRGGENKLYLNDGTTTPFTQNTSSISISHDTDFTEAVALGDMDGDGDLDLVVGNAPEIAQVNGQNRIFIRGENKLYLNNGTADPFKDASGITISSEQDPTSAIALGDISGDGTLDLVAGNPYTCAQSCWGGQNKIYLNNGMADPFKNVNSTPLSANQSYSDDLALGDIDGDGDLDLITGESAPELYINNGTSHPFVGVIGIRISIGYPNSIYDIALGDVNGDGMLDLAAGNKLYLHPGLVRQLPNNAPYGAISRPSAAFPGGTNSAGLLSAGRIISNTQLISFTYTLSDPEGDPANVRAEYSLDGGGRWHPAAPAPQTITHSLTTSPTGMPHTFVWDTSASGVFGQSDTVVVRLFVSASRIPTQYAYTTSTTFPFRLRSTIARVIDSNDQAMANALVYRLPSGTVQRATPLTNPFTGLPILSNYLGYVASRNPLLPGDRLAALQEITHTEKFTLYYTSPIATTSGLPDVAVDTPRVYELKISPQRPLIAFNLNVSLEWDARNDAAYMLQLRNDLARASELLYDWTDGQAVLGKVTIYHDKQHWEDVTDAQGNSITHDGADIQIYASNRIRPNSDQGGVVLSNTPDPDSAAITYTPGALRMPATWNRNGDAGGTLGEDWPRTLAHELGHFALYLDDNYLGLDANKNLVPVKTCPGAMSDPYSDLQSEFRPKSDWLPDCAATLSNQTSGRSDWATITRFYPALHAPDGYNLAQNAGPRVLALGLLQITGDTSPGTARQLSLALSVTQPDGAQSAYAPSPAARAALYRSDGQRAIDLGAPTADLLLVRGARNGDTVCLYDPRYRPDVGQPEQHLVGCTQIDDLTTRLPLRPTPGWRPDLQITPVNSRTVELRLPTDSVTATAALTLSVRLFPDDGAAVSVPITRTSEGNFYQGLISFDTPALGALLRLWAPEHPLVYEAVADYSLGGDPAPRRRKKGRSRRRAPALSADGQVILFTDNVTFEPGQFFAFQTIDQLPTPPDWATPVGFGYRLLASEQLKTQVHTTALAMSYFAADVPAGAEGGITLYYYCDPSAAAPPAFCAGKAGWQPLSTTLSPDDNTASAKAVGEGLYALMASVPLELEGGWNYLYSYPGATQELPAALSGAATSYNLVYGYAEEDDADPWKLYAAGLVAPWDSLVNDMPRLVNNRPSLEHGASYWLHATQAGVIPVRPSLASASPLAGAASIGIPPATFYGLAPAGLSGPLDVEALVGPEEASCGSTTTTAIAFNGQSRPAFSLNVLAYGGAAPGCGIPGAEVRLVFRDSAGTEVGSYRAAWDNTRVNALGGAPSPLLGHQRYLPLVHTPGVPAPDLQIVAARIVPAPPGSGEDYAVEVTVRNRGAAAVAAPFWVDLYVDPDQAPQPGEGWPAIAAFGASWRVYDLAVGATIVLSSLAPNDPLDPGRNYTLLPFFLEGETYTLYAQADAYATSGASQGAIAESDETNNIGGPYVLTPTP